MGDLELKNWLSKIKEFSVGELLTVQEALTSELRAKTTVTQTEFVAQNGVKKAKSVITFEADKSLPAELQKELEGIE
jgi:hypothetical protein